MTTRHALVVCALGAVAFGCSDEVNEAESEAGEVIERSAAYTAEFREEINGYLRDTDEEIEELRSSLADASQEVRDEVAPTLDRLEGQGDALERRLAAIGDATGEELNRLRSDFRDSLAEIEYDLEEARLQAIEEQAEFEAYAQERLEDLREELAEIETESVENRVEAEYEAGLANAKRLADEVSTELQTLGQATEAEFAEARMAVTTALAALRRDLRTLSVDVDVNT